MAKPAVLFRGGMVLVGDGAAAGVADVRVANGRIQEIGRLRPEAGEVTVDLDGLCLAPGFIDTHTHADCAAFLDSSHEALALANLRQGVTTQVCGNCGFSPFPVPADRHDQLMEHIRPAFGPGTRTFATLADWRAAVEAAGVPTNLAPLVGHGTLRAAAMGFEDRPATDGELEQMERSLEQCLDDGAFGLSSGLIYTPGTYAPTEELIRLARVAARHGAPYASHMRNETERVEEAVQEAIRIGTESRAGVHISHHKAAGRANWGKTARTLEAIDRARASGQDITLDVYPYTAGSTVLQALLPPWVQQGGTERMLERLRDQTIRQRIADEVSRPDPRRENLVTAAGWDRIVIAGASSRPAIEGRSIAELARGAGQDPIDFSADLLLAERGNVTIILHMMDEADVRRVLSWPHAMVGSDGILQPGRPHPRLAGSFARVLGHYVRDEQVWPLAVAVHRMTGLPAHRFKIPDRGRIAPGAIADLMAFEADRISDRATYEDPLQPPDGVVHVMVNGVMAIENGRVRGRHAGRVLSHRSTTHGA